MELISPTKQRNWGWPAVVNFFLGGAGSGFYLLCVLFMPRRQTGVVSPESLVFGLLGPILVGIGFLALTIEAGRPKRSFYLYRRIRDAWISRETLFFTVFIFSAVLDWVFPDIPFRFLAVCSAFLFMISQGFIVHSARALPAWNVSILPVFFLSSGLASGSGIALLLMASGGFQTPHSLVPPSLLFVVFNLLIWVAYLFRIHSNVFRSVILFQGRSFLMLVIFWFGHVLPAILLLVNRHADSGIQIGNWSVGLAGFAMLLSVMMQKSVIIFAWGYTRKISIES